MDPGQAQLPLQIGRAGSTTDPSDPSRGISRVSRACDRCRLRKVRCDGHQPCARCKEHNSGCIYRLGKSRIRPPARKLRPSRPAASSSRTSSPAVVDVPTGLVSQPPSHAVVSPCGQWHEGTKTGIGLSNSETGAFQFYGPSSHFAFVQRVYDRLNHDPGADPTEDPSPVPAGLRAWGLENFLFSHPNHFPQPRAEAFLPRNLGELFIRSYFKLVHPQMPVLVYSDVMSQWTQSWKPPARDAPVRGKEILHMVLAIGALVAPMVGADGLDLTNEWAEYFARNVDIPLSVLSEPTLQLVHILLLKALYAQHVMRPNETYLYLGYAMRAALSLGLNRVPVVDGSGLNPHHLKVTFWITFASERVAALLVGRPSSLRDDQIDAPYPQDQPTSHLVDPLGDPSHSHAITQCAFVRVLAEIGKMADRILIDVYPLGTLTAAEQYLLEGNMVELDSGLNTIAQQLPDYLNFLDEETTIGEGWQEIQRLHLGLLYHTMRMLMHRPVIVFTTFFSSNVEAQQHAPGIIQLQESITASVMSARSIIHFAHEILFTRQPDARSDGSLASYLVAACITLLYQVLDPATTMSYAKETFSVVEQAIRCLDGMNHLGPRTGKRLSTDIMRMAKNVVFSSSGEGIIGQSLVTEFPWLE
ncbi:hypothetical protein BO78DRAFT_463801 [Aspergillus sclerotiicarbonarius CBS 121057]|uniref:Zn(2)-C6 fungal-type domain-containing protein n=1 Tax=Aspergillus sclerotiicarbonarius (strain CBS 121057 / IBT 28362) TaxID=1448318 RepID=A0A319E816_ASPSB|nr:hypothetical protein BO78DRAFT_463801 [Aspergillus sclerotiicarbonarius CBS 121057]